MDTRIDAQDHLLRVGEAADRLAVAPRTIRRMIDDRELPVVRIRGSVRLRASDLDALIAGAGEQTKTSLAG